MKSSNDSGEKLLPVRPDARRRTRRDKERERKERANKGRQRQRERDTWLLN